MVHARAAPERIDPHRRFPLVAHALKKPDMLLLMLEALAAGCLLALIVWWTMFAGRNKGERKDIDDETR